MGELAEVIKSPQDKKLYRRTTLQNGIEVLLIHDPEIDLNAADVSMSGDEGEAGDSMSGSEEGEGSEEDDEEDEDKDSASGDEEPHHHHPQPAARNGHKHIAGCKHHDDEHHASTKKAAAAMAVGVGSFSDPRRIQGISHFLEHILFMGSEKFTNENEYDSFLQRHGGSSNAYTELESTCYHFDVHPPALHSALQRFAQFFISPLFKADALEREVMAVDNEFTGVLQSDSARCAQLRCHTARCDHVYNKFSWGNKKSLFELPQAQGFNPRDEVIKYYNCEYSGEKMSLVLLGGETLDTLHEWATDLFAAVPNGKGKRKSFASEGQPFKGGMLYCMPTVRDGHQLTLSFQLPCLNDHYRAKAEDYISHLIGHEGKGSLLSALKSRGWATELSAGVGESGYDRNSCCYVFDLNVTLTESGLEAAPGAGLAVVELMFHYIHMLRQVGPQRWVYDEVATISNMKFRFSEEEDPMDYVTRLSAEMHLYPPEHTLLGPHLYDDFNPQLISEVLSHMTPEGLRADLQTSSFECVCAQLGSKGTRLVEPWFDLPYLEIKIEQTLIDSWRNGSVPSDLHLPPKNDYIPSDFTLVNGGAVPPPAAAPANGNGQSEAGDAAVNYLTRPPVMLQDEPGVRLWYKLDDSFNMPRTNVYCSLVPQHCYDSPAQAAYSHLIIKLLEDELCEVAYAADVSGLHYNIWPEAAAGMDIKVDGFSHKLPLLCRHLLSCLKGLSPQASTWERVKEGMIRKYRNANMKVHKHATYLRLYALKAQVWDTDDVLKQIEAASLSDVLSFLPTCLEHTHMEILVHGNISQSDATTLASDLRATLGTHNTLLADQRKRDQCIDLGPGGNFLYRCPAKVANEENCAVELYIQCGRDSPRDRALLAAVEQLTGEPIFDTLRSKEQLGYSLHSGTRLTFGVLGFCVVLVSGTHGPAYVESRIEAFLSSFAKTLEAMSEDEWNTHRSALMSDKQRKDSSLAEEAERHWEAISSRRYNFRMREEELEQLRGMTKKEVQDWYNRFIAPSSPQRSRLSIHVVPTHHADEVRSPPTPGVTLVDNLDTWKAGRHVYPVPQSKLGQGHQEALKS